MEQNYVALQGKTFEVSLQSMRGSTGYGWCISSLPQELILIGIENRPTAPGIAPVIQKFYFGVVSAENINVEIKFVLVAPWKLTEVADTYTAKIQIVPCDSGNFACYSENANMPFFSTNQPFFSMNQPFFSTNQPFFSMNQPFFSTNQPFFSTNQPFFSNKDAANINEKYGYPCGVQDAVMKYGYPDNSQDIMVKYGYPCGVQDAVMKYGYPDNSQDIMVKYGYPCGVQDAVMKYGYPDNSQDIMVKYGYPCGVQDATMKYGYPCQMTENSKDARPYGFPGPMTDMAVASNSAQPYGYVMTNIENTHYAYGYPRCC